MNTRVRSTGRTRAATLGLAAAFALSGLITAAQLIDAARGSDLGFGERWGPLIVGALSLVLMIGIGTGLRRSPAGVITGGAVVLAVLAWLSMIVWWVAVPAFLGVTSAWVGGVLDADRPPRRGAARSAGIVGLFAAAANAGLVLGALALTVVQS